jgi:preprotein translocase subunit SecF
MNLIKYTKYYILLSLLILIPGIVSLAVFKLNLSIDFVGGSVFEFELANKPDDKTATFNQAKDVFAKENVPVEQI